MNLAGGICWLTFAFLCFVAVGWNLRIGWERKQAQRRAVEPFSAGERLRVALAWYAEPTHWRETGDGWLRNTSPAAADGGALARTTLKNLENEKEQGT